MKGLNTRKRHIDIYAVALETVIQAGGYGAIDSLENAEWRQKMKMMEQEVVEKTKCRRASARFNIGKIIRQQRHEARKK